MVGVPGMFPGQQEEVAGVEGAGDKKWASPRGVSRAQPPPADPSPGRSPSVGPTGG